MNLYSFIMARLADETGRRISSHFNIAPMYSNTRARLSCIYTTSCTWEFEGLEPEAWRNAMSHAWGSHYDHRELQQIEINRLVTEDLWKNQVANYAGARDILVRIAMMYENHPDFNQDWKKLRA